MIKKITENQQEFLQWVLDSQLPPGTSIPGYELWSIQMMIDDVLGKGGYNEDGNYPRELNVVRETFIQKFKNREPEPEEKDLSGVDNNDFDIDDLFGTD